MNARLFDMCKALEQNWKNVIERKGIIFLLYNQTFITGKRSQLTVVLKRTTFTPWELENNYNTVTTFMIIKIKCTRFSNE